MSVVALFADIFVLSALLADCMVISVLLLDVWISIYSHKTVWGRVCTALSHKLGARRVFYCNIMCQG